MKHLRVLCPQGYVGIDMVVGPCNRCSSGWSAELQRCTIDTGAEHLPDELIIPDCPIQDRCQHQLQADGPCVIRSKGLICESAFIESGMPYDKAVEHPLSFNAQVTA